MQELQVISWQIYLRKKSTEFKTRPWRLNLNDIEIVEHNGILSNEEYIRKNKLGYFEFITK